MKPPPQTKQVLYLLHFYLNGLASMDDVVQAASVLDDEEKGYFKMVAQIAVPNEVAEERVLPLLGRIP